MLVIVLVISTGSRTLSSSMKRRERSRTRRTVLTTGASIQSHRAYSWRGISGVSNNINMSIFVICTDDSCLVKAKLFGTYRILSRRKIGGTLFITIWKVFLECNFCELFLSNRKNYLYYYCNTNLKFLLTYHVKPIITPFCFNTS